MSNTPHGVSHALRISFKRRHDVIYRDTFVHGDDVDLVVPLAVELCPQLPMQEIRVGSYLGGVLAPEHGPYTFLVDVFNALGGF